MQLVCTTVVVTMNLGQDILDAVNRGGLWNWSTTTKQPIEEGRPPRNVGFRIETRQVMDKILNVLNGQMTSKEICEAAKMKPDAVYKYMVRLIDAGEVKRSQHGQPYKYWRM